MPNIKTIISYYDDGTKILHKELDFVPEVKHKLCFGDLCLEVNQVYIKINDDCISTVFLLTTKQEDSFDEMVKYYR